MSKTNPIAEKVSFVALHRDPNLSSREQYGKNRTAPDQEIREPNMSAMKTIRKWQQRVRARHELAALGDRMLKDIGITRADAVAQAGKPFWKE
jgi:uncharacterized protein YjiS (DUF1127 family)